MNGKVNKTGGGNCAIKGIVEEAKARGIITAGDFVELIKQKTDESGTYGEDTLLYNTATKNYEAVLLSENRVAIGSIKNSGSSALYVIVCEFDGMTINVVNSKMLCSTNNSSNINFSICALNENKFCVLWQQGDGNLSYYICEVIDNEIADYSGTAIYDATVQVSCKKSFISLSENRILGICLISNFVNIVIFSINNNTVELENKYLLKDQKGLLSQLKKISNDRILAMIYSRDSSAKWDYYLITVEQDAIVINDKKEFNCTSIGTSEIHCTSLKLDYNKFILFYSNVYKIFATIININADTINDTFTETLIYDETYCGTAISSILIDSNNLILLHSKSLNCYLYSLQCNIREDVITISTDTQISAMQNSGLSISNVANEMGLAFIAHSYSTNNYMYGMMYDPKIEKLAQKVKNKQSTIARHSKNKCKRRTTC